MRWGIIGFGRIARKFTQSISYLEDSEIIAIGSKSLSKEDEYLKDNPSIKLYRDYEKILTNPAIDAVYIALPHKFHYEWAIKALKHHKAVLCEKPAVLTVQEMENIKETALANDTFFLEALKTKMNTGIFHLKKDLPLIGKIKYIEANFCTNSLSRRGTDSFLYDENQGGALNDVGTYLIGFVLKLIDEPINDIKASAKMYGVLDEHFNARISFENGVVADIEGAIDMSKNRYAKIVGEKGEIMVPMFNHISEYIVTLNNGKTFKCDYPIYGNDMTYQIQELQECVKKGLQESPLHTLDDSIKVIDVIEKIRNQISH